jgi:RNA polymerase sigma-70 factor (ECF subfamily)
MSKLKPPRPAVNFSELSDPDLLNWIKNADQSALGELYDRYHRLVYSLAYQTIGESAVAEEITQDVFLRIWEKAATYRVEQGKVITWIVTITRNRAIDLYRRRRIRPENNPLVWEELTPLERSDGTNIEAEVDSSLMRTSIRTALASLPAEQRQALSLAFFRGYSHSEIAENLQEPIGTIKTRIRLAMQKLRHYLMDEAGMEND